MQHAATQTQIMFSTLQQLGCAGRLQALSILLAGITCNLQLVAETYRCTSTSVSLAEDMMAQEL